MAAVVIQRLDEVGSTMDAARHLAESGAPHGSAVQARVQTGGRGRSGRPWISPPGNLHATVVLRPGIPLRRVAELGFVCAVAVADAVDRLAGAGTALKWPNDVLRQGAKLAGLLLERLEDGTVLFGLGMNVAHRPRGMPYPVTSLHALGCSAGTDAVLDAVLAELAATWAEWQDTGFAPVLARWRQRGPAPGAPLQVRQGDALVSGVFAGLSPEGALLLDTAAGRRTLLAGDVLL